MTLRTIQLKCPPLLDPGFVPAVHWNRAYAEAAAANPTARVFRIGISRPDGTAWNREVRLLPDEPDFASLNWRYTERMVKFLLWAWGGNKVSIEGAPEIAARLCKCYQPDGARCFDANFMGTVCFLEPFEIATQLSGPADRCTGGADTSNGLGRHLDGCRIGFDLGGSDRKCAALIDGKVVYSEEIKWNPYFESDPAYHAAGIRDSLRRAAAHLPRVDAIGGSAAGIYINNEPRVASLFRGLNAEDFSRAIRPLFRELRQEWGNIPFEVANDGDVTALAGAMAIGGNGVLGISMGTSLAAGYIDPNGHLTGWLNELAFAPVDYREGGPVDEWSGDHGCGVQYFSQQAVGRLMITAGIEADAAMPLPEKLEFVQQLMQSGDERAAAIYQTVGTYLGYSIAHYREFYDFQHLLILGRVSSGDGGKLILTTARKVLETEFPEIADAVAFPQPDEQFKRHGQAVAAASLPVRTSPEPESKP